MKKLCDVFLKFDMFLKISKYPFDQISLMGSGHIQEPFKGSLKGPFGSATLFRIRNNVSDPATSDGSHVDQFSWLPVAQAYIKVYRLTVKV